jgi:hypothetical protein
MKARERAQLRRLHARYDQLRAFLESATPDRDTASATDWNRFLIRLEGRMNCPGRELGFAGRLMARDFLVQHHRIRTFPIPSLDSRAYHWHINVRTTRGERIVAFVTHENLWPYVYDELLEEKADHHYLFFTCPTPFHQTARQLQRHHPKLKIWLLPEQIRFVSHPKKP